MSLDPIREEKSDFLSNDTSEFATFFRSLGKRADLGIGFCGESVFLC